MTKQPAQGEPEKRFIINIGLGNDGEPTRVFVGANGEDYLIQRGKDVAVPKAVLNVLDDAIIGVPEVDEKGNVTMVDRKRFPYTVVGVAP